MIKNPEISALVPTLLLGLTDPNEHTRYSLDVLLQVRITDHFMHICTRSSHYHLGDICFCCLLQTTFINSIDSPSLALLVPIIHRGLRERSSETKKKAAQIAGNMCSLVTEPKDMIPYINLLLPEIKKVYPSNIMTIMIITLLHLVIAINKFLLCFHNY